MRTYDASDEHDKSEAAKLGAEPWMLELLALNPEYVFWGPHEDYMWTKGDGWNSPQIIESWKAFDWKLNELNECVNFYFQIRRENEDCKACEGSGLNPETKEISDNFYHGEAWHKSITQDEVDALVAKGRLRVWADEKWNEKKWTADEVNAAQGKPAGDGLMFHDAINRWILIETRAARLGVYGKCATCSGEGSIYTEPTAHASLVLWILHPRKGCSRGVEIKHIDRDDLPAIRSWLEGAAERNAQRFSQAVSRLPRVAL